jgi:hypothetical protein
MILSTCNLGGKSIPLRVLESLDEVLVDTDGDVQADEGEPIAGVGPEGAGSFGIDVRFAGPPLVFTIPKNTTAASHKGHYHGMRTPAAAWARCVVPAGSAAAGKTPK